MVTAYAQFGGKHGESAALKNLLAHHDVALSEALCFGIAGGIGAGYSFCPSVVRYGGGSGVSIVGRHLSYATGPTWYEGFCERLGLTTRITETTGRARAFQNLKDELAEGRPTVVWCSRFHLPFLGRVGEMHNLWMHSFIVYTVDEAKGVAYGADRAPTRVPLTLDQLAEARAGVCSHKNRTLTVGPPTHDLRPRLPDAVRQGVRACAGELLQGRMKTYSLPGLELWAQRVCNTKSKDGWPKVFGTRLLYEALRDTFDSIETCGTGGGLYRGLYADFLREAAQITGEPRFTALAGDYEALAGQWTSLADQALPDRVKPFKRTKELLRRRRQLFETKGAKAAAALEQADVELTALQAEMRTTFPLDEAHTMELLAGLHERIVALHQAECAAAERLQQSVA